MFSSHRTLTCLEVESVASRARKGRVLSQAAYDSLLGSFSKDLEHFSALTILSDETIVGAIDAARTYSLRAADAMHLATVQVMKASTPASAKVVFVSSDRELIYGANGSGITTLDPERPVALATLRGYRRPTS